MTARRSDEPEATEPERMDAPNQQAVRDPDGAPEPAPAPEPVASPQSEPAPAPEPDAPDG